MKIDRFDDVAALEEALSRPSQALVDTLATVPGDIMVLGVGGKMGPTLARMAKRAAPGKRIIGVARFSEAGLRGRLQAECQQTPPNPDTRKTIANFSTSLYFHVRPRQAKSDV